jgi:hypothetical protein
MMYAETREAVEQARASFLRKWRLRCKAVVSSFEEAGDELFTFLQFPPLQWKALRRLTHWSASTRNSAGAPKPKPRCRAAARDSSSCRPPRIFAQWLELQGRADEARSMLAEIYELVHRRLRNISAEGSEVLIRATGKFARPQ